MSEQWTSEDDMMRALDGAVAHTGPVHVQQFVKFLKAPEPGSSSYYLWHPTLQLGVRYLYRYSPVEGSSWAIA